jgi:drug/metabolite transporter (DMT)-like permease
MSGSNATNNARVHGALFTVALLFSFNYLISKLGMRELAPLTFGWLRVIGAAVILSVVARGEAPLSSEDKRRVAGWSLLGVVINISLFLAGLALTSVQVSASLITTMPVFTLAIAIMTKQEAATASRIGGIALAAAGALLVVGGESIAGSWQSFLGALMIVANCLSYSIYLVISKSGMKRLSARRVVSHMFTVAAVAMLPIAAWPMAHEQWTRISMQTWLAVGLTILGPTVGAYLLQAWALRHADSSVVASYVYVQPVLATLLGVIFLGEKLRVTVVIAGVMISAGVWLATSPRASRA